MVEEILFDGVILELSSLHCSPLKANGNKQIKQNLREFPGGLVVRIPGFLCHGPGSFPGRGTEILQVSGHSRKQKQKTKQGHRKKKKKKATKPEMLREWILWPSGLTCPSLLPCTSDFVESCTEQTGCGECPMCLHSEGQTAAQRSIGLFPLLWFPVP